MGIITLSSQRLDGFEFDIVQLLRGLVRESIVSGSIRLLESILIEEWGTDGEWRDEWTADPEGFVTGLLAMVYDVEGPLEENGVLCAEVQCTRGEVAMATFDLLAVSDKAARTAIALRRVVGAMTGRLPEVALIRITG